MSAQVELRRGAFGDADSISPLPFCTDTVAVGRGGDGDVARCGLGVDGALQVPDRQRAAGGAELDVAGELAERRTSPDAVEIAAVPARVSTAIPPEALSALMFPATDSTATSPLAVAKPAVAELAVGA